MKILSALVAVEDERLDRAQSRCPVLANRDHEQDTWTDEPVLRDPAQAYTSFRGRLPTPEALLEKRGLVPRAA